MVYFDDTAYKVTGGNIVYAKDLNNPLAAIETAFVNLVGDIQTSSNIHYAVDTGLANAYALALDPAPSSYTEGLLVWLKPLSSNTGAATLNVNLLGAKSILKASGEAIVANDLVANYYVLLKYNGSVFQIISGTAISESNAAASATAAAASAASVAVKTVDDVEELIAMTIDSPPQTVIMAGYHSDGDGGGGDFYWNASGDKADHDGGAVIDPDITFPSDWTNQTQVATWFTAGTGAGTWDRVCVDTESNVKHYGAKGNGTTNDTIAIQTAIDMVFGLGGGTVLIPKGQFKCRDISLTAKVNLVGLGASASKLRFLKSGNDSADSTSYVIDWVGSYGCIRNLTVDGQDPSVGTYGNAIGNGIRITADGDGFHRVMSGCDVKWFSGYTTTPTGGTYGINQNYANTDIVSGVNTLLVGGNAVLVSTSGSGNEMLFESCNLGYCDGTALNLGSCNDGKVSNVYLANAMFQGLAIKNNQKNWQIINVKVYLCRRLNLRENTLVIPFTETSADSSAAVVLTGGRHLLHNVEVQESGSNGFAFGTSTYGLFNSTINIVADGNGGYDPGASAPDNVLYRRYGVFGVNYYGIKGTILGTDFRARLDTARQSRAFHSFGTVPTFTTLGAVVVDNYYRITDVTGGADFEPLQEALTTTSNAVGFVFEAQSATGDAGDTAAVFGTGYLSAVNGYSIITIQASGQTDQLDGTGLGYNVVADKTSEFQLRELNHIPGSLVSTATFTTRVIDEAYNRFEVRANGDLRWGSGSGSVDVSLVRLASDQVGTGTTTGFRAGSGGWDEGHLTMGSTHIWVDATGDLRIKSSAPSSDTDGSVVGSQS